MTDAQEPDWPDETDGPDEVTRATRHALHAANRVENAAQQQPTRREVQREIRRVPFWVAFAVSSALAAVAIVVSAITAHETASSIATVRYAQEQQNATQEQNRQLAQKAYDSAREANTRLAARGQAPVPVPPPNPADPTSTIAAGAAAIVLANLPPGKMPSSAQVAKGVADFMATHPTAPASPGDIFPVVATYLAQNPPPAGPQGQPGDKGDKGDPPSEEAIQAAFVDYVNAHPDWLPMALCQGRGEFGQAQDLVLADGGRVSGYLCITGRTPPPTTTTVPEPTTTTTDGGVLPLPGH